MILTDEAALIILAVVGGIAVVLIALFTTGVWLVRRGRWRVGAALAGLAALLFVGPVVVDGVRALMLARDMAARNILPGDLDLTGKRILFIEGGGTRCGDLCSDVVRLGTDAEVYFRGTSSYIPWDPDGYGLEQVLAGNETVRRIRLGPPLAELDDARFPEPIDGAAIPEAFDLILLHDNEGFWATYYPDLLGPPAPRSAQPQFLRLVFDDWLHPSDPVVPQPRYRFVSAWQERVAVLFSPFSATTDNVPPLRDFDLAWRAAICPQAGPPEERDARTYDLLCSDLAADAAQ